MGPYVNFSEQHFRDSFEKHPNGTELQKRADRADQSVLFFLAGANFWEKHAKTRENTRKQAKNRRFFGANFLGGKLVGATFYAFCNYAPGHPMHLCQDQDLISGTFLKQFVLVLPLELFK